MKLNVDTINDLVNTSDLLSYGEVTDFSILQKQCCISCSCNMVQAAFPHVFFFLGHGLKAYPCT